MAPEVRNKEFFWTNPLKNHVNLRKKYRVTEIFVIGFGVKEIIKVYFFAENTWQKKFSYITIVTDELGTLF